MRSAVFFTLGSIAPSLALFVLPGDRGDLVDQSVVQGLPSVEIESIPGIFGDLLRRPAGALHQASVESPEEILLPSTVRDDRVGRSRELSPRLGETKACVRSCRALIGGRRDADGEATDLSPATRVHRCAKLIERIDENERGLERSLRAV